MHCSNCNAQNDEGALFCGVCGKQLAPLYSRGSAATEISSPPSGGSLTPPVQGQPPGTPMTPMSSPPLRNYQQAPPGATTVTPQQYGPGPSHEGTTMATNKSPDTAKVRRPPVSRVTIFLSILTVLCLVSISVGVLAIIQGGSQGGPGQANGENPPAANGPQGQVVFTDTPGLPGSNDHVQISITGLEAPSSGAHYTAWMIDEVNERPFQLGQLVGEPGSGPLTLGLDVSLETNLLGRGNKLEITQETTDSSRPTGNVMLSATFPQEAFVHIQHILFKFPTVVGEKGLLMGTLEQVTLLHQQGELLKNNRSNLIAVQCIARNIGHIISGKTAPGNLLLPASCRSQNIDLVGDGQGLLGEEGYVALAADHANRAARAPDASKSEFIEPHAGQVLTSMDNLTDWLEQINQDVEALQDGDLARINTIASLAENALNGVDINGNGQIEAITGESGAKKGYESGQLMIQLTLVNPS